MSACQSARDGYVHPYSPEETRCLENLAFGDNVLTLVTAKDRVALRICVLQQTPRTD